MKYLFILMLAILTACGGSMTRAIEMPAQDHIAMVEVLKSRAVALVRQSRSGDIEAYCSGVWISQTEILTAAHCVMGDDYANYSVNADVFEPSDPTIVRNDIKYHTAWITKRDLDHDLVVMEAKKVIPAHGIAPVYPGTVVQGAPVQTMGQPFGNWFSYSSGEISAIRVQTNALGYPMLLIQATAPISPGSSGGGLYDENGMVIGIVHGSYNGAQNLNLFIHTSYIRSLLASK